MSSRMFILCIYMCMMAIFGYLLYRSRPLKYIEMIICFFSFLLYDMATSTKCILHGTISFTHYQRNSSTNDHF